MIAGEHMWLLWKSADNIIIDVGEYLAAKEPDIPPKGTKQSWNKN